MGISIYIWYLLMIIVDLSTSVKDVPMINIEALIGETVYLPCNMSNQEIVDDVILILWYREDKGTPIYSVDVRDRDSKSAKRWSDESIFANRAYFIFEKYPGELAVQSVKEIDTGIYRCRVDFKIAQTKNVKVNLTIIVPPEKVSIKDGSDAERTSVVGPYTEGESVKLKCDVYGGKPPPTISWYRDGMPLRAETNFNSFGRHLRSEISLGPLTRQDLNSRLTCRTVNHQKTSPIEATVQIDMNFAPLNIRLLGSHQPLSAGRRYDLLCQSTGSRPPAMITWFLDGERIESTTETTSNDGNQTTSTLSITISRNDAGKYLSCKATNTAIPSEILEDGWKLDIQYIPETNVKLGTPLDPESVREGTDLYFDCIVSAHPLVYKVEWRHNGQPLLQNVSKGVIISNHSLVLQGVSKSTAGNYSCVGFNSEGDGVSPPFELNVMYTPTCSPNQPRVYGVAKQENAQIKCSVDANPNDVDFKWTFNNSAESIEVAASHIARIGTLTSAVSYTPMTELDYGTLLCVASNKIGKQKHPCVFHIIAAGKPDQVHNCTISNISMTSLGIKCVEGFSGGLTQSFMVEVRDLHTQDVKANVSSPIPRFTVNNLQPGGLYSVNIFAFNAKGRSDPLTVPAAMLRLPEKRSENMELPKSSVTKLAPAVILATALALILVMGSCVVVLILRCTCNRHKRKKLTRTESSTIRTVSPVSSNKSTTSKDVDGSEADEKNPDVIPEATDTFDQINFPKRQYISTIDATREKSANSGHEVNFPQNMKTSISVHSSNNNPYGYCTLRSGSLSGAANTIQNSTSHLYNTSFATSTLPRHSIQAHQCKNNSNTVTNIRNAPVNSNSTASLLFPPLPPPSTIAMHQLGPSSRSRIYKWNDINNINSLALETPLLVKQDSIV